VGRLPESGPPVRTGVPAARVTRRA
jgi:hypothetical protein